MPLFGLLSGRSGIWPRVPYVISIASICCPLTVLPEDCGNAINSIAAPKPLADCSMLCTGNGSEFCGGQNRLNLYKYTPKVSVAPAVQTINLPGNWQYSRCLAYVYLTFLSTRNHSEAAYPDIQRAGWYFSSISVSGHVPPKQHCPKLSYTMLNLWLSRGGYGKWR